MKTKEILLTSLEQKGIVVVEKICCPVGGEDDVCVLQSLNNKYYISSAGHSFEMLCEVSKEFYNAFKKEFYNSKFIEISTWRD